VRLWCQQTTDPDGVRLIDKEWVRLTLARVAAKVQALYMLNLKVAWSGTHGAVSPADASAVKVFGSELSVETARLLLEIVGQAGYLKAGSTGARLQGRLEYLYRNAVLITFGGGVNEIQRELIAMIGLGLPRAPR
jgi:alkylation response protein AidB-like acyl-CoA dehydrogenase